MMTVVLILILMIMTLKVDKATRETMYLDAGAAIIQSLYDLSWSEGGWASVQSVHSRQLEDHMPSYFLAEACKYLYLLFDDSFLQNKSYIFTTEGHPIPLLNMFHEPSPASAQLEQLARQPPTPLRQPPMMQTVVLTPDQPQLWQLFQSVKQHFAATPTEVTPAALESGTLEDALEWIAADTRRVTQDSRDDATTVQECDLQQNPQENPPVESEACKQQLQSSSQECTVLSHDDQPASEAFASSDEGGSQDASDLPNSCQKSTKSGPNALQRTQSIVSDAGIAKQKPDALRRRVCPAFGHPYVEELSLCHILDSRPDGSCDTNADCGIDSVSCRGRICSVHGFCQAG